MTHTLETLLDKDAIKDVRTQVALALDTKDWDLFKTLFTDQVEVDFSSMGIPAQTLTSEGIAAMFRASFEKSQATQQLYSNFLIDVNVDSATCASSLLGHHFTPNFEGGSEMSLRGRYVDHLKRTAEGWKITATTFHFISLIGNAQLIS